MGQLIKRIEIYVDEKGQRTEKVETFAAGKLVDKTEGIINVPIPDPHGIPGVTGEKMFEAAERAAKIAAGEIEPDVRANPLVSPRAPATRDAEAEEAKKAEEGEQAAPEPNMALRGELPDDFPHRQKLVDAGLDTYGKVRAAVKKGDDWYENVPGIGEKTAPSVLEALTAKPEEEEEE